MLWSIIYAICNMHSIFNTSIPVDELVIPNWGSFLFKASKRSFTMKVNWMVPWQSFKSGSSNRWYTFISTAVLQLKSWEHIGKKSCFIFRTNIYASKQSHKQSKACMVNMTFSFTCTAKVTFIFCRLSGLTCFFVNFGTTRSCCLPSISWSLG